MVYSAHTYCNLVLKIHGFDDDLLKLIFQVQTDLGNILQKYIKLLIVLLMLLELCSNVVADSGFTTRHDMSQYVTTRTDLTSNTFSSNLQFAHLTCDYRLLDFIVRQYNFKKTFRL